MFLSPRVVDGATFEEFTTALKEVVEQAGEQSEGLGAAIGRSETILRQLLQAAPAVESKLTAAAAASGALARRQAELETLLARAEERAQRAEQAVPDLVARFERVLEERLSAAEARIAGLVGEGVGRIKSAAAEGAARATDASADAAQTLDAMRSRLDATLAEFELSAGPWLEKLESQVGAIEGRLARADREIAPFLGAGVKSLTTICARASALLGREPGDERSSPGPGSLAELLQKAERTRDAADFAIQQLDAVRARAEDARAVLEQAVGAAAGAIKSPAKRARRRTAPQK